MELKKSPKADLERRKGLFLEIGLCISLGLMIVMFAWSQSEKKIELIENNVGFVETETIEVTRQEQKPPEPVKQTITVVSDIINVVKNDTKITTDLTFMDYGDDVIVVPQQTVKEETVVDDAPFITVEVMPKFQKGDLNTFRTWVMQRLKYPPIAAENGITGRVTLAFVIERDGSLTNIEVLQTPDRSLSDEATRVLKESPKWDPGRQRNTPVRVKYTLPIEFTLQ